MSLRRLTSLMILFIGVILVISGVILFIMPHGRVAYWTDWRFLGLNKDQWSLLHVIFSIIFILLFALHTFFNIKPLIHYFNKSKKELLLSFLIITFLTVGSIFTFFPFNAVKNFEEKVKNSWIDNKIAPKIPHGELMTLKKLSKRIGIKPNIALKRLNENGIKYNSLNDTIQHIAKINGKKPIEIYKIIKTNSK